MRVGFISFAHFHAWTYGDLLARMCDVTIAAISDADVPRGRKAADRYRCPFIPDYHAMLQDDTIDCVIICAETVRHAEIVVSAAQAGKAILCEKPMALNLDDAHRMIAACQETRVYFQLALPNRYLGPIRDVKDAVDRGNIGRVHAVHSTNRGKNPGGWFLDPHQSGGGALIDHTIHAVDILRWVLNAEITEVYAEMGHMGTSASVEDIALLTMMFDNGVIASHDPSCSYIPSRLEWGDLTFEFVGDRGGLRVDGFSQGVVVYDNRHPQITRVPVGLPKEYFMLREFLDHCLSVHGGSAYGIDGLRALEVTLAAYQSAALHRPIFIRDVRISAKEGDADGTH
ncbi:MAG: gfo/Idh/MocA family oxidoreductase [Sulfobacillus benefaciens]|uniref:Gfo/Idh/MocA family oxidoreductase n=1 Tax=Sulfobacillus benefaciens TaxID=453960 RepID=A0A2T2X8F1_9FIRM|nr:MAG: gfo/Idh/MocA family oxidoreductase [Sulfobacillus benefaciens]